MMLSKLIQKGLAASCLMMFGGLVFAETPLSLVCPSAEEVKTVKSGFALPYGFDEQRKKARFLDVSWAPRLHLKGWFFLMYPVLVNQSEEVHAVAGEMLSKLVPVSTQPYHFTPFNADVTTEHGEGEVVSFCVYQAPVAGSGLNAMAFYLDEPVDDEEDMMRQLKSKAAFLLK